jgi:hypothetical protein
MITGFIKQNLNFEKKNTGVNGRSENLKTRSGA